jgi:hypothetical protein
MGKNTPTLPDLPNSAGSNLSIFSPGPHRDSYTVFIYIFFPVKYEKKEKLAHTVCRYKCV